MRRAGAAAWAEGRASGSRLGVRALTGRCCIAVRARGEPLPRLRPCERHAHAPAHSRRHGRLCMLAFIGFIANDAGWGIPGLDIKCASIDAHDKMCARPAQTSRGVGAQGAAQTGHTGTGRWGSASSAALPESGCAGELPRKTTRAGSDRAGWAAREGFGNSHRTRVFASSLRPVFPRARRVASGHMWALLAIVGVCESLHFSVVVPKLDGDWGDYQPGNYGVRVGW